MLQWRSDPNLIHFETKPDGICWRRATRRFSAELKRIGFGPQLTGRLELHALPIQVCLRYLARFDRNNLKVKTSALESQSESDSESGCMSRCKGRCADALGEMVGDLRSFVKENFHGLCLACLGIKRVVRAWLEGVSAYCDRHGMVPVSFSVEDIWPRHGLAPLAVS